MTTTHLPTVLCLSASPHLQAFDRPLLQVLAKQVSIAQWEYQQTPDEPCSLEIALVLLHDYLKQHNRPIDLIGHGISGLLALLYAQRHPKRVRSLTLVSVGVYPAVDWQAHYYAQRQLLPCSRQVLLTRMVDLLFGYSTQPITRALRTLFLSLLLPATSRRTDFGFLARSRSDPGRIAAIVSKPPANHEPASCCVCISNRF